MYGEDGLDVCKSQYLKPKLMDFLKDNAESVLEPSVMASVKSLGDGAEIKKQKKTVSQAILTLSIKYNLHT